MGVVLGTIVAVAVLAAATVAGLAWQRRNGRLRRTRVAVDGPRLTQAEVGQPFGDRATFLQFSSTFCAPCRATRRLLADVIAGETGVTHVEIDVADRLDLVRLLDVRRTPTTFVLGPDGRIAGRASGLPRRDEVVAALAAVTVAGAAAGTERPSPKPTEGVGSDSEHGRA